MTAILSEMGKAKWKIGEDAQKCKIGKFFALFEIDFRACDYRMHERPIIIS